MFFFFTKQFMSYRSSHINIYQYMSFFLAVWYSIAWVDCNLLSQFPIDGPLGFSNLFCFTNNSAVLLNLPPSFLPSFCLCFKISYHSHLTEKTEAIRLKFHQLPACHQLPATLYFIFLQTRVWFSEWAMFSLASVAFHMPFALPLSLICPGNL